jgi:hypothetical protein
MRGKSASKQHEHETNTNSIHHAQGSRSVVVIERLRPASRSSVSASDRYCCAILTKTRSVSAAGP